MTQARVSNIEPISPEVGEQPLYTRSNVRELALVSLISPILFMGSLISAAILVMSDLGQVSGVFWFWLIAQCLACAALFLSSIREKSVLFSKEMVTSPAPLHRFSFIALGFIWGVVPGILAMIEPAPPQLVMGAVLSGLTMAAALLLPIMPGLAKMLLTGVVGCFAANAFFYTDIETTSISLIMLSYFSGLAVCARWYYARLSKRLVAVESVAAQARELSSVLKDVGHAADTYFWRTDRSGLLTEMDEALHEADIFRKGVPNRRLIDLFEPSAERDLLEFRISRQSEIVALELEIAAQKGETGSSWWKLSARPVYIEGEFDGYRGAASSITSLKASERRAAFLAEYDSLTGLLNRSSFYRAVQLHLDAPALPDSEGGLLWIDLDNFKWINDTFGHSGGDEVLQSVAERLQTHCESDDVICRFGGDEFAILATRASQGDCLRQFVEDLTAELAKSYELESSEIQCSASIGFKRITREEGDTAASLMKEADLALYSAKSDGRATWKEYSEAFKARIRGQRELARDLKRAIGTNDLQLRFQPIVDGKTAQVIGVEALSRWFHPTRGAISPSTFIQLAENNGMIIDLGDAVMEKAIEAAAELPDSVKVGINISPLQIHSSALLGLIESKLAATGVDPSRIELEITETVFLSDNAFVLERLGHLKDLGLRIALDDFGTGFSSLAYLQRFPFDKLKLDQAFVRGIESSDQSCAIARATISMAHALGLTVTAEGVETEAQARFLVEQRCDELQGYLYGQPQAQAELIDTLKQGQGLMTGSVVQSDGRIISLADRHGPKT
ncbi:MAG: bifunctional diguanylate cyclase/phosphodiesterase [Henriciella sp.]|nr:bifunctional diguanylate cyclase/phosphodiesterase [Henriciella sp.]